MQSHKSFTLLLWESTRSLLLKAALTLLQTELRREALHLAEEFREKNRTALLNLLSDGTIALTGFILLLRNSEGRRALFGTTGRVFSGFSDTAKAFLIIACKPRPSPLLLHCPVLPAAPQRQLDMMILRPQPARTAVCIFQYGFHQELPSAVWPRTCMLKAAFV